MPKRVKWIIGILIVLLVILGALTFAVIEYVLPYQIAENTMPAAGTVILRQQEDRTVHIAWPAGVNVGKYHLELLRPAQERSDTTLPDEPEILYSAYISDKTEHIIDSLPDNEELTLRIRSLNTYSFPFEEEARIRYGEQAIEITAVFCIPEISDLTWTPDVDTRQVNVQFGLPENGIGRIYYVESDGTLALYDSLAVGDVTISFGEGKDFKDPGFDEVHTFVFDAYTQNDGYIFYGLVTDQFSVVRDDLLGTNLTLTCIDEGDNVYTFVWNETKGEHYELQRYDESNEKWVTVHQVPKRGERTYTTERMERYTSAKYRVTAVGSEDQKDSGYLAVSEEIEVKGSAIALYATIWPIKNLEIYSSTTKTQVIGTAAEAQAYCVLDEKDGMFYIHSGEISGYIDSNYCMINLPEYIGDICLYDITNSYASYYTVHNYEIPTVSGQVVVGYEEVEMESRDFLVPLLYPTAKKLENAAFAAMEQGYKLKIYDSYRPREATLTLYDIMKALCPEPIPEEIFVHPPRIDPDEEGEQPPEGTDPTVPEQTQPEQTQPEQTQPEETQPEETQPEQTLPGQTLPEQDGTQPGDGEEEIITYEMLMTDDGRYTLNYFLAKGGSRHNQGIAMDLTLVDVETGEELQMQTAMHDLSWYSELEANNENAELLEKIMLEAGFGGLVSEWWHFQDNDAYKELKPPYLKVGVTPECWMLDDNGWRYRQITGEFYVDCKVEINGVYYTFGVDGYALNGPM